jgi:hypothetical protein
MKRLVMLLPLLMGCASQTGMGRARTVARGQSQIGVGAEASVLTTQLSKDTVAPLPWVHAVIGYRRGLTRDVDVGARAWGLAISGVQSLGAAGDVKVQIARTRTWEVAAGGSLGYHQFRLGGAANHVFTATLPLLFGLNLGRDQLVFGPRVADYVMAGEGQRTINTFWVGGSLGYWWQPRVDIAIMPELVLLYTPISFHGEVKREDATGAASIQLGLGVHFDL